MYVAEVATGRSVLFIETARKLLQLPTSLQDLVSRQTPGSLSVCPKKKYKGGKKGIFKDL